MSIASQARARAAIALAVVFAAALSGAPAFASSTDPGGAFDAREASAVCSASVDVVEGRTGPVDILRPRPHHLPLPH